MLFRQHFKRCISFLLVISLFLFTVSPVLKTTAVTTNGYITGVGVNVRTEPTTASVSNKITKLSNVYVEVLETVQGENSTGWGTTWYKIKYGDIVGYVYGEWLQIIKPTTGEIPADFEQQLLLFPEDYRPALRQLKASHPNWSFTPQNLSLKFWDTVKGEDVWPKKLVAGYYGSSWKTMIPNAYDWSGNKWISTEGNWHGASTEVIAYHLDPRNFLDENNIYIFAQQSYDPNHQNESGLQSVISGTFLANGYPDDGDGYSGSYSKVIMEAARQSGMSPYVIAALIILEQGPSGNGALISGNHTDPTITGYYNFFNYGATGTTNSDVVINGLNKAKEYGWNTRAKSIIGGATVSAGRYVKGGQDTYYFMNFDVKDAPYFDKQYAQNIEDAIGKGSGLRKYYGVNPNATLNFVIPVYQDMPENPVPAVPKNDKLNNYYFTSLSVSGFDMFKYEYSLTVGGNTRLSFTVPSGASYSGNGYFSLKKGTNTVVLPVLSQTGYVKNYTLTVTATADCYLAMGDTPFPSEGNQGDKPTIKLGDTNLDGVIDIVDLANIQKYLLNIITLTGDHIIAADTNADGIIDIVDLANVQKHLLCIINLG